MTREEEQMIVAMDRGVKDILVSGLRQGHALNSWLTEPVEMHLLKSMGHIVSAEKMRQGFILEDAEGIKGHLLRALTRIAMALWIEKFPTDTGNAIATTTAGGETIVDATRLLSQSSVKRDIQTLSAKIFPEKFK